MGPASVLCAGRRAAGRRPVLLQAARRHDRAGYGEGHCRDRRRRRADAGRRRDVILYPAIDLKDGAVVRLARGAMDAATKYSDDPAAQAASFAAAGAQWLHVVDLDGAISGRAVNGEAVDAILGAVRIPVQDRKSTRLNSSHVK